MYEAGALWGWGLSRQKNQTDSGVETQDSVCQGRGTQMSCGCSVAILERRGEEWWGPLAAAKTTLEVCVCNRLISQASFWAPETSCSPKARGVLSGITGEWAPNESGCQGTPAPIFLPSFPFLRASYAKFSQTRGKVQLLGTPPEGFLRDLG